MGFNEIYKTLQEIAKKETNREFQTGRRPKQLPSSHFKQTTGKPSKALSRSHFKQIAQRNAKRNDKLNLGNTKEFNDVTSTMKERVREESRRRKEADMQRLQTEMRAQGKKEGGRRISAQNPATGKTGKKETPSKETSGNPSYAESARTASRTGKKVNPTGAGGAAGGFGDPYGNLASSGKKPKGKIGSREPEFKTEKKSINQLQGQIDGMLTIVKATRKKPKILSNSHNDWWDSRYDDHHSTIPEFQTKAIYQLQGQINGMLLLAKEFSKQSVLARGTGNRGTKIKQKRTEGMRDKPVETRRGVSNNYLTSTLGDATKLKSLDYVHDALVVATDILKNIFDERDANEGSNKLQSGNPEIDVNYKKPPMNRNNRKDDIRAKEYQGYDEL